MAISARLTRIFLGPPFLSAGRPARCSELLAVFKRRNLGNTSGVPNSVEIGASENTDVMFNIHVSHNVHVSHSVHVNHNVAAVDHVLLCDGMPISSSDGVTLIPCLAQL